MRVNCPHCGERDRREFTILGDASVVRQTGGENSSSAMFDYIYLRTNNAGVHREYWYHGAGCHAWLIVERNTVTHEILSVQGARGVVAAREKESGR